MNLWRRGTLSRNPYARTAFRVARVPREVAKHRAVVLLIGQTKRIVSADPRAHALGGEPVTLAELNAAAQILLDPVQRIREELLEHSCESLALDHLRSMLREISETMGPGRREGATVSLAATMPSADTFVLELLHGADAADPRLGALELDVVPPFGNPGSE